MDNIQITKKAKSPQSISDRTKLISSIKSLKKGQCLEYRGPTAIHLVRQLAGEATAWLSFKYSGRAVEGGIDIFCE